MNVGDRVTVVWGFPPETWVGIVEALPDRKGLASIRPENADPDAYLSIPIVNIDLASPPARSYNYRAADPETSRLAAASVEPRLTEYEWIVLETLVKAGRAGLIDHEHEARNGLLQDTAGKRRKRLQEHGYVEPTGERRQTPRGRTAEVFRATARGIAAYQQRHRGAA